ncbi:MAG TPA: ATP-dependent DNA helicase RecG, partial [Muribaculaceae bacterium]|nr:ATP-dependent DNA helicase RecG [Muribaculaceae bacterium]
MNPLRRIEIQYVKGIGPKRAELLTAELGIRTAYDLLRHFPNNYIDRSKTYRIADLTGEMPAVQLRGRFVSMNTIGEGAKMRLSAIFTDGTGTIEVVWFRGIRNIREMYNIGTEYVIFGKPTIYGRTHMWNMAHPEVDAASSATLAEGLHAVYPLTEKLRQRNVGSRQFHQWITTLLSTTPSIPETLPASVIDDCRLMSLDHALRTIHNPTDSTALQRARERLKFEELLYIQADMVRRNLHHRRQSIGHVMPRVGRYFNTFYGSCLPFSLTEAQKRVVREVHADMRTGHQMNRLVQGDVGSGKTLVALMTML